MPAAGDLERPMEKKWLAPPSPQRPQSAPARERSPPPWEKLQGAKVPGAKVGRTGSARRRGREPAGHREGWTPAAGESLHL